MHCPRAKQQIKKPKKTKKKNEDLLHISLHLRNLRGRKAGGKMTTSVKTHYADGED